MSRGAVRDAPAPGADAVAPEWLGEPAPPARGRVVRGGAVPARTVELPTVEDVVDPAPAPDDVDEDEGDRGADQLAWALAYQRGFEEGRAAGYAEGVDLGRIDGFDAARSEAVQRYEPILRELQVGAQRHLDELDAAATTVSSQATELAFSIAQAVVGRELSLSRDPGADAVRRAVAAVGGPAEAVARLHPDDIGRLTVPPSELAPGAALRIVPDDSITPGDCLLEAGAAVVDASTAGALARVRATLGIDRAAPIDEGAS